jgi:hypothetical protein
MPRYNNPGKTWQYTNDSRIKAVQLHLSELLDSADIEVPVSHGKAE